MYKVGKLKMTYTNYSILLRLKTNRIPLYWHSINSEIWKWMDFKNKGLEDLTTVRLSKKEKVQTTLILIL